MPSSPRLRKKEPATAVHDGTVIAEGALCPTCLSHYTPGYWICHEGESTESFGYPLVHRGYAKAKAQEAMYRREEQVNPRQHYSF